MELFPAVSFEHEGDAVLFSESLEWKGVDVDKSETIETYWDDMTERYVQNLEKTTT